MGEKEFLLSFTVRDYECDLTGVVNNAVYQNYLEHARHEYFRERLSVSYADLAEKRIALVIIQAELFYKSPLRPGDEFVVSTKMERLSKTKFQFIQHLYRQADQKTVLKANLVGAAMNEKGRPLMPDDLMKLIPQLKIIDER